MEQPKYYTIIPAEVRYNKNLSASAKLLYGEISTLCKKDNICWASNSYFAELYNTSKITVSRWFSQLEKEGYISTKMIFDSKEKKVTKRLTKMLNHSKGIIKNDKGAIIKNVKGGIIKNVKENIPDISGTNTRKRIVDVFTDLEKECYKNIVPLFKEDYRPKTKQQKLKWIKAIKDLNDKEKINPRQTYYIIKKTLEDDFWTNNFRSPLKLRTNDKNGVKWVYVFKNKYAKDMIV